MIKIIKEGQKEFITTCLRCGCEFSYEISDLKGLNYIYCPCCDEFCYHCGIDGFVMNLPETISASKLNEITSTNNEKSNVKGKLRG